MRKMKKKKRQRLGLSVLVRAWALRRTQVGLRLTLQHGREAHVCKGVHGGATQSLKPLLAAGVVKEGRGGYEGGEGGGGGGHF